ncbi:matrix metalloproteinase-21-like [Arapaima gigas]
MQRERPQVDLLLRFILQKQWKQRSRRTPSLHHNCLRVSSAWVARQGPSTELHRNFSSNSPTGSPTLSLPDHPSIPSPTTLVERGEGLPRSRGQRYKRTRGSQGSRGPVPGLAFARQGLRWRLLNEGLSSHLSGMQQRRIVMLAFRRWAEVTPLIFQEDTTSPATELDIKLAFGTGRHLGCPWLFDGPGGELAHAAHPGEIHLDDDEPYSVPPSEHGVNLLQVLLHEIGHVLGLPHLSSPDSVMHPQYPSSGSTMELSQHDRTAIQELYGQCEGTFDTVFDWITISQQGGPAAHFNTYFLKGNQYWLYDNSRGRPRPRDPRRVEQGWGGLPSGGVDAHLHVWTPDTNRIYFFKGIQYWLYDRIAHQTITQDPEGHTYPRRISEGFPGITGPLDTAVFSHQHGLIFFFKGHQVWGFNMSSRQVQKGFPKHLLDMFPPSQTRDHPTAHLDAAYYSYFHRTLFLIKGLFFWEVSSGGAGKSPSHNTVLPRRRVAEQWKDLCNVQ